MAPFWPHSIDRTPSRTRGTVHETVVTSTPHRGAAIAPTCSHKGSSRVDLFSGQERPRAPDPFDKRQQLPALRGARRGPPDVVGRGIRGVGGSAGHGLGARLGCSPNDAQCRDNRIYTHLSSPIGSVKRRQRRNRAPPPAVPTTLFKARSFVPLKGRLWEINGVTGVRSPLAALAAGISG